MKSYTQLLKVMWDTRGCCSCCALDASWFLWL